MLKKRLTRDFPHQYQKPRTVMYRADAGSQRMHIFGPAQRTSTQSKKFLSEETHKEALAEYLYVVCKNADLTIVGKNLCLHIQINVTVCLLRRASSLFVLLKPCSVIC